MAITTKKKSVNVSAQRTEVQRVIAAAVATDVALAAAEDALSALQTVTTGYAA